MLYIRPLCLDVYLYILFDNQKIYRVHPLLNESWWLLTADLVNCLKPMALKHRHGWLTVPTQLGCTVASEWPHPVRMWLWPLSRAAGKTDSHWPQLQAHDRALEKLLGLGSNRRLHSPCVTHWRVRGRGSTTPTPTTHTHKFLQLPLSSGAVELL